MGELLGIRLIASEFNAYLTLSGEWIKPSGIELTERSQALVTYALCGFSTFASIGIQIGGIGPLAPERTGDLARLGLRACWVEIWHRSARLAWPDSCSPKVTYAIASFVKKTDIYAKQSSR